MAPRRFRSSPVGNGRTAGPRQLGAVARRRLGAIALESLFHAAARLGRLHPDAAAARHRVQVIRNVPYDPGGAPAHRLDVYRPDAAPRDDRRAGPPWPIVLYAHGGAFRMLSKETHWALALAFAREGYLVFNVDYRLAPRHPYPAALSDVCRAFVWVAAHARAYGGDPSRIVLAGESAGANLVASLALALSYPRPETFAQEVFATGLRPAAVVPACGVFQVSDLARLYRRKPRLPRFVVDRLLEMEQGYLGGAHPEASLDLADPVRFLEDGLARGERPTRPLPPWFLAVGTRDPLLPDTRRLASVLRALGAVAEDAYYPGELHAFHALLVRQAARTCWGDTFRFLARHVGAGPK